MLLNLLKPANYEQFVSFISQDSVLKTQGLLERIERTLSIAEEVFERVGWILSSAFQLKALSQELYIREILVNMFDPLRSPWTANEVALTREAWLTKIFQMKLAGYRLLQPK